MKSKPSGLRLSKKQHSKWRVLLICLLLATGVSAWAYIYMQNISGDGSQEVKTEVLVQDDQESEDPAKESRSQPESAVTPATQPYAISIPSVGVSSAAVMPVGIESNGDMATPPTNHDVGWYDQSDRPKTGEGALLLNGHVGIGGQEAVFTQLHNLAVGATIEVQTGDGSTYSYRVYHVEQLPLEDVDMRKMMRSVNPSKQGLNIITCAGEYDESRETYDDRVLVYAVRA